ncbi:MAG TPA: isoprenyl transferase [Thiotrichales bacterium]|nr:isoprenyl transferase [Thiotrichales bacterium]
MSQLPRHVAIIMDGNGRWAQRRRLPRTAGHKAGVNATREVVEACGRLGIEALTLFAFSSENWRRPREEVGMLMELFVSTLRGEVKRLDANRVRLRFIGERGAFSARLRRQIEEAEAITADNEGLRLNIAANYGGRWDIANAARRIAERVAAGEMIPEEVEPERFAAFLCLADLPEPDLFIRTGGEQRISNFLLWQLAYTELWFTEVLWPDFGSAQLEEALEAFATRQRRFGLTGEQVRGNG